DQLAEKFEVRIADLHKDGRVSFSIGKVAENLRKLRDTLISNTLHWNYLGKFLRNNLNNLSPLVKTQCEI
ncbi:MAG TPA: hypothetical protein VGC39_07790, partial [Candidatus Methylacidiphilales bacterium]